MAADSADSTGGRRLVRSRSGLKFSSDSESTVGPLELQEPEWVPDEKCDNCMICNAQFDLFNRRHHCRRCGKIACSKCCHNKLPLPRMNFVDPVRQCESCVFVTKKENEFFDKHLKTLLNGGSFWISGENESEYECPAGVIIKLTPDYRSLFMTISKEEKQKFYIELKDLASMKFMVEERRGSSSSNSSSSSLGSQPTGFVMKYRKMNENIEELKLEVAEDSDRRQTQAWIVAMHKALKLMSSCKQNIPENTGI